MKLTINTTIEIEDNQEPLGENDVVELSNFIINNSAPDIIAKTLYRILKDGLAYHKLRFQLLTAGHEGTKQ